MSRQAKSSVICLRVSALKRKWIDSRAVVIGSNTTGVIEHLIEDAMANDHYHKEEKQEKDIPEGKLSTVRVGAHVAHSGESDCELQGTPQTTNS